jgi:hypothetical protein
MMIVVVVLGELSDLISKITGAGTAEATASSDDDDDDNDDDDDCDDDDIDGLATVILFLLGLMSMVYGQRKRLSI